MPEHCAWCHRHALPGQRIVDRDDKVFCSPICSVFYRERAWAGATIDPKDLV